MMACFSLVVAALLAHHLRVGACRAWVLEQLLQPVAAAGPLVPLLVACVSGVANPVADPYYSLCIVGYYIDASLAHQY